MLLPVFFHRIPSWFVTPGPTLPHFHHNNHCQSIYTSSRSTNLTASSQLTGYPYVVKRLWEEGQRVEHQPKQAVGSTPP